MPIGSDTSLRVRPIFAAIQSVPIPRHAHLQTTEPTVWPFVTISREAGAGGWTLAQQLVEVLNRGVDEEQYQWSCWDRELVSKVAADNHASQRVIESLETVNRSWFTDFLGSIGTHADADESRLYGQAAAAIRALAQAGRSVIVGLGSVFVTRKMPGGIHIRLHAPFEHRVKFMAEKENLSHDQAVTMVRQLEKNRAAFMSRYWASEKLTPELFDASFNTAAIPSPVMAEMIAALVRSRMPGRPTAA